MSRSLTLSPGSIVLQHPQSNPRSTRRGLLPLACLLVIASLAATARRAHAEDKPSAERLVAVLDGLDVEHHWLPGHHLKSWRTGEADDKPLNGQPHTHCSAFVAVACKKLGVPMLSPPPQTNLANRQGDWLLDEGQKLGWKRVDALTAQQLVNAGQVVVASFKNTHSDLHSGVGHIAMIRPSTRSKASIQAEGPQITQAGGHNYNSAPLNMGFAKRALEQHEVKFFAFLPNG